MVDPRAACDLCGLELGKNAVVGQQGGLERHFCCPGCARVFEVASQAGMLEQALAASRPAAWARGQEAAKRPAPPAETIHFSMDGMWCAGCAVVAERILRREPGVTDAQVSFAAGMGRLRYQPGQADPLSILHKLDGLGYAARALSGPSERREERQQEHTLFQLLTAAGFGMQVMVIYIQLLYPLYGAGQAASDEARRLHYLAWFLTTPILFYGGISFLRGAWRALRARTATMDTLVALGTLSAYGYSAFVTIGGSGETYFDSVGMITTFVMLGRYLELLGGAQARKDVSRLLKLQPDLAWRLAGGAWQSVPAATLAAGDEVLVKPGERVPADAMILTGDVAVDESLITGESLPVNRGPGEHVLAGSVITDGAMTAKVTQPAESSRLAQIARLVDQTLGAKAPIQRLADTASAWFAVGILAMAAVTVAGWLITGHPLAQATLTGVAVLVVACPCALGLATPLAMTVAVGRAAQAGVVIRNPAALEGAVRVDRMVFDKTGTLTRGHMSVVAVETAPAPPGQEAVTGGQLLCFAAGVEQFSEHPIARAIVAACPGPVPSATEFRSQRGLGASARVEPGGRRVLVGSRAFLGVQGDLPLRDLAARRAENGETVVWVGWDALPAGFIALRDEANPTAAGTLRQLAARGIGQVMLSGDDRKTVAALAAELGIGEFAGDWSPAQKLEQIRAWQAAGERVGMAGDGINDAPALAQADLSITVAGGADVAGDTSDVLLMRYDLGLIPWFLDFSRRTRQIIRQNLGWAFAYNLLSVSLAMVGAITPAIAAVAMTISSLIVVGNSLRLQR